MQQDDAALALKNISLPARPGDELVPRDEFLRIIGVPSSRASGLLRVLLARCNPDAPLPDKLVAIEQLGRFVVAGPSVATTGHPALVRLEWLVTALEELPAAQRRFEATLGQVLEATRGVKLLGEIGLPNDRGLLAETTDRLARRLLPEPPATHELWRLAGHIIRTVDDLAWLGPAADPLLDRLAAAGGGAWKPLRSAILDAIGILTTRIAALGMSEALRSRTPTETVRSSPLYQLTRAGVPEMPGLIAASREHLEHIRTALEDRGVSIDVVYSIDAIERGLARLELLLPFVGPPGAVPSDEIRAVIAAVGHGLVGGRSFTQLLGDSLRLLARKVIERAGRTGEHYVTSSRREYWGMLGSAALGGVITCATAVAKFLVKWGHFAPFLDGFLSSLDYAGSFVVMQLVGATLATKQPSMTAAALAGTIRDRAGPGRLDELVPLIARIARSQFAAAVGNVSAVIVTALAFDLAWQRTTGAPFLDAQAAKATVASFDPLGSGTLPFAALTGVLLWISSLAAGWFENWIVYRRLPEAIEHHRIGKRVGRPRMAQIARFLEREAAGFGGSIALGFLLGMIPAFAKFFGLPIDVRHITLSTGSLTLALSSIGIGGAGASGSAVLSAAAGIALIGLFNFGVSFALALVVALRARDVPRGEAKTLPGAVFHRFVRRPLEFFYPPRNADPPQATSHPHGTGVAADDVVAGRERDRHPGYHARVTPFARGLHELGNRCYAYLQPDGSWGWSNAGLVLGDGASLLVDTLFDLKLTAAMLDAMAPVRAAAPISTVVNTHANGDHCYGNQLVKGAEIVASTATAGEMGEVTPAMLAGLSAAPGELGEMFRGFFGAFDFTGIELTLPTRTFDGRLALDVGGRTVALIEVGPAHTRGDTLVHVPDARTVYTGDVLFIGGTPVVWAGPLSNWIAACDLMLGMDVETVVPGHGPVTDKRGVAAVRDYLAYIDAQATARFHAGMDAWDAARDIALGEFAGLGERGRIAVNVEAVYRTLDPAHRSPSIVELFQRMAALERPGA